MHPQALFRVALTLKIHTLHHQNRLYRLLKWLHLQTHTHARTHAWPPSYTRDKLTQSVTQTPTSRMHISAHPNHTGACICFDTAHEHTQQFRPKSNNVTYIQSSTLLNLTGTLAPLTNFSLYCVTLLCWIRSYINGATTTGCAWSNIS